MSDPNTNPFIPLHQTLSQPLSDYDSVNPTSPTLYYIPLKPTSQSPSAATLSGPHPSAQQTENAAPSQIPNKESLPGHTPRDAPQSSRPPSTDDIYTLLLKMGQVQDTMRTSIANLEAVTARALHDTTSPPQDQNNETDAANTRNTRPAVPEDATKSHLHAGITRARVASPPPPRQTVYTRGSHAPDKMTRLEAAPAQLERENSALREEVEGLKRANRRLRTEWRRNAMLQGLRWIGRDF
ncbi:hypothetical protein DPSP01_000761 [Paraphaeosphaeria sporulosa]